ncbi:hypothetical protein [Mycobacteroides abscessus]|uniref:hypothetical protein n=1 Tax=Mycobacteroides abscessus TaxID=36809 RepID=UPI0009A75777|nr:hypothetical protein [Mycobacteroides abscessus]RIT42407.1 hypothetical protein D2E80_22345 [Mycobacteroides abscessus]SKT79376.1 Uncharacterised protein [Mycobacteroides abscessus subsp. massiliense]SKU02494.1 Uncharacterised protein [Mycobacteroides abscessus subsp. massiliense]
MARNKDKYWVRGEENRQSQIWEAPVLDRNPILAAIERVDRDYPGGLLTGFVIYTSHSPYDHQFFVVMYFNPSHRQALEKLSAIYTLFAKREHAAGAISS